MPACCGRDAYAQLFDERNARRDAREYLKKGLDPTGRRMVDEIVRRGVAGASVLEVGGGIGALQIDLLRSGAARATNVEIVATYEQPARELLETLGLTARVDRKVLDFASDGDEVGSADIVVLHRVICCYPDMEALVRASADHANRILALSFPSDRWWWRAGQWLSRGWFRLRGCAFRLHLHDPRKILATAESSGLRPILQRRGFVWQIAVMERSVR
ncbi:MAG: class I SAM-dependent methyltransferase [Candidatus Limnocylindria bacterium]